MKYLFCIYTDTVYKHKLDNFKTQEFYQQICNDPNIEVIECGADYHIDYSNSCIKTQEMMKWCSENKEYDYLIKCDVTIFDEKWSFYRPKLTHENIFVSGRDGNCYACPSYGYDGGEWIVVGKDTNKNYWGLHQLEFKDVDWPRYFDESYDTEVDYDLNFVKSDIRWYAGKFYMVSRDFSIFIGEQENFAKRMAENFIPEDLMVGYLAEVF